jgi:hypothetical protein
MATRVPPGAARNRCDYASRRVRDATRSFQLKEKRGVAREALAQFSLDRGARDRVKNLHKGRHTPRTSVPTGAQREYAHAGS